MLRAATSSSIISPFCTSASGPPTADSGAALVDVAFHVLGDAAKVRIARCQLGPGVADADYGPAVEEV
jgi:hypothetical protein